MAEEFNMVIEHLRSLRSDISDLKQGQRLMHDDILTIKHHLSGFMSHEARQDEELALLRNRLERIETRLDIFDDKHH